MGWWDVMGWSDVRVEWYGAWCDDMEDDSVGSDNTP